MRVLPYVHRSGGLRRIGCGFSLAQRCHPRAPPTSSSCCAANEWWGIFSASYSWRWAIPFGMIRSQQFSYSIPFGREYCKSETHDEVGLHPPAPSLRSIQYLWRRCGAGSTFSFLCLERRSTTILQSCTGVCSSRLTFHPSFPASLWRTCLPTGGSG